MAQNNMGMVKLFGRNIKAVAEEEYKIPSEEKKKRFCCPDGEKEDDQNGGGGDGSNSNTGEKTVKKPDKILPCPRCNSVDTKFCYFNNYNVNQPRYFCRNCQRYWTAGGSMRNVPVGAGRRKNKIPVTSPPSTTGSAPVGDMAACNQGDENSIESQNYSAGPPWIYNCNPAPILPGTNFCLPPPSLWGFSVPGTWSIPIPWMPSQYSSIPNPPLGKHSRYGYILNQTINSDHPDTRKCQKVKKDSSSEATTTVTDEKSAWLTMGTESSKGDGLFKGFSKVESSPDVMHVNPAALSRSICFRESMRL